MSLLTKTVNNPLDGNSLTVFFWLFCQVWWSIMVPQHFTFSIFMCVFLFGQNTNTSSTILKQHFLHCHKKITFPTPVNKWIIKIIISIRCFLFTSFQCVEPKAFLPISESVITIDFVLFGITTRHPFICNTNVLSLVVLRIRGALYTYVVYDLSQFIFSTNIYIVYTCLFT